MAKRKKSKCQVTGPFASKAAATRKLNKKGSKLKGGFVAKRGAYYIVKCPKGK